MDETDALDWLRGELGAVLEFLDTVPQERPQEKTACPAYAAGLRDMAAGLLEKIEHEQSYQDMRAFLGESLPPGSLPEHGSKIEFKKK